MSEEIMPQDDLETPEPQDAPDEQDKQSEIIKRIKRAEAKGRKEAEQALLESLGLDSVDTIKAVIEAQRQREEAEKSEAERLQAQLEKVKAEKQAAEERLTKIEQEREQAKRDAHLRTLATDAHAPEDVVWWINTYKRAELADADSDKDYKALVEACRKDRPHWFKTDTSPGIPSNNPQGRPAISPTEARLTRQQEALIRGKKRGAL